jgi:hypothetical protein
MVAGDHFFLEAVCTLPPTKAECLLFEQNLLNSVSARIFNFILAFFIRQHQPGSKGYETLLNVSRLESSDFFLETCDDKAQRSVGVGGLIGVRTLRKRVPARTVPSSSDDVNVDVPWGHGPGTDYYQVGKTRRAFLGQFLRRKH